MVVVLLRWFGVVVVVLVVRRRLRHHLRLPPRGPGRSRVGGAGWLAFLAAGQWRLPWPWLLPRRRDGLAGCWPAFFQGTCARWPAWLAPASAGPRPCRGAAALLRLRRRLRLWRCSARGGARLLAAAPARGCSLAVAALRRRWRWLCSACSSAPAAAVASGSRVGRFCKGTVPAVTLKGLDAFGTSASAPTLARRLALRNGRPRGQPEKRQRQTR